MSTNPLIIDISDIDKLPNIPPVILQLLIQQILGQIGATPRSTISLFEEIAKRYQRFPS